MKNLANQGMRRVAPFFDYVKSSLHNNAVREFQGFDSCSEDQAASAILTEIVIDISLDEEFQANSHVMRGLQAIIPSHCMTVLVTPAGGGGKKVRSSLQQLRKELKGGGQRKSPPELHDVPDHTPPALSFVSIVSNRSWHNELSTVPMNQAHWQK